MAQNSNLLFIAAFFLLFMNFVQPASAQFINLHLKIDSKLTAQSEQALSFEIDSDYFGKKMIHLGDVNMGIFSLSVLEKQTLLISLDKPVALFHQNPAVVDEIPVNLSARYGFSSDSYEKSFPLKSSLSAIRVEENKGEGPWDSIYIFMFGSITVDDIAYGLYSNNLVLNVEYL